MPSVFLSALQMILHLRNQPQLLLDIHLSGDPVMDWLCHGLTRRLALMWQSLPNLAGASMRAVPN